MTIAIRSLPASEIESRRREFVALLADAIDGGASVGFVQPIDASELDTFWRGVGSGVAAGDRSLLIAERRATIVGTVQLVPSAKSNQRHRADVSKLLVHRSARCSGVATALMQALEALAHAEGRWLLTLDTRKDSDAERLYRRLGWTEVGAIPDYAADPDQTLAACTFFYKRLAVADRLAGGDNG